MKPFSTLCLLAGLWLAGPVLAQPAPVTSFLKGEYAIPNIGCVKNTLREYFRSGLYKEEVAFVAGKARDYLEQRLNRPLEGKAAIVFDVDETALSNYSHIEEMDFGFQATAWNTWVNKGSAPALEGTLELYRFAKTRGIAVFFVSGRTPGQRGPTENNLRQAGFEGWQELILKDPANKETTLTFKTESRRKIVTQGYTIVANVGDQDSDLQGGYCESVFKIPNPLYWVP